MSMAYGMVRPLRFEKRYDWFKDCGDKEVVKETWCSWMWVKP